MTIFQVLLAWLWPVYGICAGLFGAILFKLGLL